jgi:hypothetical protein
MLLQPTGTTVEFSGTAATAAAITALSRRTVAISFRSMTRPLPPMRRSAKSRVVAVLMIGTQWRLRHQCATAKQWCPHSSTVARHRASCELFTQQVEPWPSMNVNPCLWREIGLGSALPGVSNKCLREPGSYHAPGSFSFKARDSAHHRSSAYRTPERIPNAGVLCSACELSLIWR